MREAPILLASRRIPRQIESTQPSVTDFEEDDWEFKDKLLKPYQIVIAGDDNRCQLFSNQLYTAPQEELLESE